MAWSRRVEIEWRVREGRRAGEDEGVGDCMALEGGCTGRLGGGEAAGAAGGDRGRDEVIVSQLRLSRVIVVPWFRY